MPQNVNIIGAGATTVTSEPVGSTTQFEIQSSSYQVAKANNSDLAFEITLNTAIPNNVQYLISWNYTKLASYILAAIAADTTGVLEAQLNALVTQSNAINLANLNGGCVINLSSTNYFLSQSVPSNAAQIQSILIGATTHTAPTPYLVSDSSDILAWLNGLGLGTYQTSYSNSTSGGYFNILTNGNANNPVSVVLIVNGSPMTVPFQSTSTSLVAVLQAIINYICSLTALEVTIGQSISLQTIDYNHNVNTTTYPSSTSQSAFNINLAATLNNLVQTFYASQFSSVYSRSYLLGSTIYTVCGQTPITLYSSKPIATGVTLYYDNALTVPVTGFLGVTTGVGGSIYSINPSTGLIGNNTGLSC